MSIKRMSAQSVTCSASRFAGGHCEVLRSASFEYSERPVNRREASNLICRIAWRLTLGRVHVG